MRLVILHGYTASPSSHWFSWLAEEAGPGVDARIPALPGDDAPERDAWVAAALEAIGEHDDVVLVGHSLGTVAAILAAAEIGEARVRGLVLVAPFWEPVATLPALDGFLALPTMPTLAGVPTVVIASDDDSIVPPALSARAAASLGVDVVTVPGAGHFLDRDGWTTLPQARDAVRAMLAA